MEDVICFVDPSSLLRSSKDEGARCPTWFLPRGLHPSLGVSEQRVPWDLLSFVMPMYCPTTVISCKGYALITSWNVNCDR